MFDVYHIYSVWENCLPSSCPNTDHYIDSLLLFPSFSKTINTPIHPDTCTHKQVQGCIRMRAHTHTHTHTYVHKQSQSTHFVTFYEIQYQSTCLICQFNTNIFLFCTFDIFRQMSPPPPKKKKKIKMFTCIGTCTQALVLNYIHIQ